MKEREVLLVLTEEEHKRLLEMTLPKLAEKLDDKTHETIAKLINARTIYDVGDHHGRQEEHQSPAQARCTRCRRPFLRRLE